MIARKLLLLLALCAAGCASLGASNHGDMKATTGGAYETQALYSCTGSSGSQIVFAASKRFVNVLVRTGVIWVKPHSSLDTSGTTPTTPIPSAGSIANGWVRLGDNQGASWGLEDPLRSTTGADLLGFLDVWCETQGDLNVIAH